MVEGALRDEHLGKVNRETFGAPGYPPNHWWHFFAFALAGICMLGVDLLLG